MTSISLKMIKVVMLSKNSCHHSPAMVVILSVAQLVTTVIFVSDRDKSRVKLDNSRKPTQKQRTLVTNFKSFYRSLQQFFLTVKIPLENDVIDNVIQRSKPILFFGHVFFGLPYSKCILNRKAPVTGKYPIHNGAKLFLELPLIFG